MIKNIFVNPTERKLRAGWRILIFIVIFLPTTKVFNNIFLNIFDTFDKNTIGWWMGRSLSVIFAATFVVWFSRKIIDRQNFISIGLKLNKQTINDFLFGLFLSSVMVLVIFLSLRLFGLISIESYGFNRNILTGILELFGWLFVVGIAVGWSEEIIFRGYLLQNMRDGMGWTITIIISCILYGLLHMANPNASILSGTLIAGIGFLRIYGYLRTDQLWLSMGMHAGWNFFQGPVFGFQVSGMETEKLINHTLSGKEWITGGEFGPEAGIIVIPVILLGIAGIYLYTLKQNSLKSI